VIDLHTHSLVSDGSEPPTRIPELAAAAGCSAVALTDHDSLIGLSEARAAAERVGITLIPGCEVSCTKPVVPGAAISGSVHMLVYFVDEGEGPLQDELLELRRDRRRRNDALVERLRQLGVEIDWDVVVSHAGGEPGGVGRPHFAQVLVEMGAAEDIQDAFDRFLADGKSAYVPKARITPPEVIQLAKASGGVAVLAHPLSLGLEPGPLESLVTELVGSGLGGLEAIYGRYDPADRKRLRRLAERVGVVATGGSDFHGTFKPDLQVGTGTGDLEVPDDTLDALAARRV
jgi:3',5'-nucleoside bisphosphate phosphatase